MLLVKQDAKSTTKTPAWYKQVISKVKKDYSNSLTLSHIAKSVALHPNGLSYY